MALLREPLLQLLEQIRPEVEAGKVSSLVVDDVGARSVGLFLNRALKLLGTPVPVIFLAPPRRDSTEAERGQFRLSDNQKALIGAHPLIVTEVVFTGRAVREISAVLTRAGATPRLASLAGFLVRWDVEPHVPNYITTRTLHGVEDPSPLTLKSQFGVNGLYVPKVVSYEVQDLLKHDKSLSGCQRTTKNAVTVQPVRCSAESMSEMHAKVCADRRSLYALAAEAAGIIRRD